MSPKSRAQQRKSLRHSLKDLLLRRLRLARQVTPNSVGSGILRKGESSTLFLPTFSTVSLFPDFGPSSHIQVDPSDISDGYPTLDPTRSTLCASGHSLLPVTSLSQFNLRGRYIQQGPPSQHIVYETVSPRHGFGISREASLATLRTTTTTTTMTTMSSLYDHHHQSASTLRLEASHPTLNPDRKWSRPSSPLTRLSSRQSRRPGSTATASSWSDTERHDPLLLTEHFRSFCVLDTVTEGCPVVATSEELRYIFDIGEPFFLNNYECEGTSMDIVTGHDAAGDEVTHLVLFSPLIIPSSGRCRFMLACLVDVTRFIRDQASSAPSEMASTTSTVESELQTPPPTRLTPVWSPQGYRLSAEDLLGGCTLADDKEDDVRPDDDVWLNIATEERCKKSRSGMGSGTPRSGSRRASSRGYPRPARSMTSSSVDEVLDDFMARLQQLYSDFFLLAKSPLDDNFYEICNVSPTVHASKDYIHGHLSRSPRAAIAELSARLGQEVPFSVDVRWGMSGQGKRLYCSPVYGQSTLTWICFLVDEQMPALW